MIRKVMIMVAIEKKTNAMHSLSWLGFETIKSNAVYLECMMVKTMRTEVVEDINDKLSNITKILERFFRRKIGIPVSWLYPPGNVNTAANEMVATSAVTTINWLAVSFIRFSSLENRYLWLLMNNSMGVRPDAFFFLYRRP